MKKIILAVVVLLAVVILPALSQQCDGCMQIVCEPAISTASGWGFTSGSASADAIANARAGCYAHGQSAGASTVSTQYWGVYFTGYANVQCNCN